MFPAPMDRYGGVTPSPARCRHARGFSAMILLRNVANLQPFCASRAAPRRGEAGRADPSQSFLAERESVRVGRLRVAVLPFRNEPARRIAPRSVCHDCRHR
jgi:hypothetical protein